MHFKEYIAHKAYKETKTTKPLLCSSNRNPFPFWQKTTQLLKLVKHVDGYSS